MLKCGDGYRQAEAYKAGDVTPFGNWSWAVGIPNSKGRHFKILTINSTHCSRLKLDPEHLAKILAKALNEDSQS